MKKEKVFYVDDVPGRDNTWMVRLHHDKFFCTYTTGSYNILAARLLGLRYAWYLRMCRDELGASIEGKHSGYPVAYFHDKLLAEKLVDLLNARATQVIWDRTHAKEAWEMQAAVQQFENRKEERNAN